MSKSQTKMDLLLKLIRYNKSKLEILNKMSDLEISNSESNEYNDLVRLYKQIYKLQHQLLYSIEPDEKTELIDTIYYMNRSMNCGIELSEILVQSDEYIVLLKTLNDLGIPLLQLYELSDIEQFGEEISNFLLLINEMIVHDYSNVYYYLLQQEINTNELSENDKNKYIKLKYRWLFLFENIEKRILLHNFTEPNTPELIDLDTLKTHNLDLPMYLDTIDEIFSNIVIEYINNVSSGYIEIDDINRLLIKTYLNMITDYSQINKEEFYVTEVSNEELEKINSQISIIYSMFRDVNNQKIDYNKIRKYKII